MSTQIQVINGQSIGTGANVTTNETPLFPGKLSLQTTTTAFSLTGRITNGVSRYGAKQQTRIWYSTSPISFTGSAANVVRLRNTARSLVLFQSENSGDIRDTDSRLESITGPYLYYWAEVPNHAVAQTLDLYVNELP